jgi:hypothetical protein
MIETFCRPDRLDGLGDVKIFIKDDFGLLEDRILQVSRRQTWLRERILAKPGVTPLPLWLCFSFKIAGPYSLLML